MERSWLLDSWVVGCEQDQANGDRAANARETASGFGRGFLYTPRFSVMMVVAVIVCIQRLYNLGAACITRAEMKRGARINRRCHVPRRYDATAQNIAKQRKCAEGTGSGRGSPDSLFTD